MKLFTTIIAVFINMINKFFKLPLVTKIIIIVLIIGIGWFTFTKFSGKSSATPQYQTATVEKGTIIVTVSGSGQVSTANSVTVSTQASGVVKKLYVENGQQVKSGDPIAELDLDMTGNQRSSQAWASYLSAKNALDSSKANLYTSQADLFTNWQTYMNKAQNGTYQNGDGSPNTSNRQLTDYAITNDQWLASEAKYKIQINAINQAQVSLNNAWSSYQQVSPIIYAPIPGVVNGLSLQIGSVITAQSNTSGTSTAQKIASVLTEATPTITVNLTEIDVPKVKIGNKATITVDALTGKTYTGKVISIDTVGSVSSGVTNYPAVIKLDTNVPEMLTNMSAQANIITDSKDNVILVPASAVQTQNGESTVRVMKNGQVSQATVTTGLASDTQVEILSGISEGDNVVTSAITTGTSTSQTQSIFGGFGSRGVGGAARIGR
jgi:membrane fusion protein, macrolide-specific efflux system